jgi:hypothetical protein
MENLVTDSIDIEEFQIAFSLLWWESMDEDATFTRDPKRVKNFQFNPKAYGFCSLVTATFVNLKFWKIKTAPSKRLRITFEILSGRSNPIYNLEFF